MIRLLKFRLCPSFLLGLVAAWLVVMQPTPAQAQQDVGWVNECVDAECEIEVTALVLASTNSSEIDTYSETDIDPFLEEDCTGYSGDDLCFAYEEVYLEDNGSVVDGPYDDSDLWDLADPPGSAIIELADPVTVGDVYTLQTGPGYVGCDYDEVGDLICDNGNILAWFGVTVGTSPPSITSINPNYGYVSTSGTITVDGNNLTDDFDNPITAAISGSGITVTVESQSVQEVILDYSIADGASTGAQSLTIQTSMGTSNAVTFNVYDPTPVVSSVSPSVWYAGTTTSITITGSGFGTNPSLSISGPGVTGSSITSSSDTQITGTVTIDPNSPGGPATVTVQSNGFNGSGFIGGTGQSSSGSNNTPQILPLQVQPPQILFKNANVAGTTQQVFMGQQIALTGVLPTGFAITSASWSGPDPANTVGGYGNGSGGKPDTSGGQVLGMPSQTCPTSGNCSFTYYYVAAEASDTVTLSYTAGNGQTASATVTFNVTGPTGNLVIQPSMLTNGQGVTVLNAAGTAKLSTTGSGASGKNGIAFSTSATPPSGANQTFTFIQLLSSVQTDFVNSLGPYTGPVNSGLDSTYPYANASATTTNDTPSSSLPQMYGELFETFSATMYLMWDPGIPPVGQSSCTIATTNPNTLQSTASTCASIPVPLSSVTWHWSGCAINTLANQANTTTWILSTANGCPVDTLGTAQTQSSFPEWSNTYTP